MSERWNILTYDEVVYYDYEVSDLGAIRSKSRLISPNRGIDYWKDGIVLKLRHTKNDPHLFTEVTFDKKRKTVYVHKAVYNSFVGQEIDYVTHIDRNVLHNYPHNLKPITHSELQIRNMQENPVARMRLSERNKASGYYKLRAKSLKLKDVDIINIRYYLNEDIPAKQIAEILNVSLSSVYKYAPKHYFKK